MTRASASRGASTSACGAARTSAHATHRRPMRRRPIRRRFGVARAVVDDDAVDGDAHARFTSDDDGVSGGDDAGVDAFGREELPWRASAGERGVALRDAAAFVGWEVYIDDAPDRLVGIVTSVVAMSMGDDEGSDEGDRDKKQASDGGREATAADAAARLLSEGLEIESATGELSDDEKAFLSLMDRALTMGDDDVVEVGEMDTDNAYLLLVEGLHATSLGDKPLHYVPFVPSMFPRWIPNAQALFLDPPDGLLDLALREVQLRELRNDLLPYCKTLGTDTFGMPQRQTLLNENMKDLVKRVDALGDWREVALELDLRPDAAPWYYWDNLDNLESALLNLVDAFWIEENDDGESYWYNDISGALRIEPPIENDGGGLDSPVMPTMSHLLEARRWDLHHAVVLHGGYKAVAKELGWQPVRRIENRHLLSFETLRDEILDVLGDEESIAEVGVRPGQLPCAAQLQELDRDDLVKFIKIHGGFSVVATKMGLEPSKGGRGAYDSINAAAKAVRAFAIEHDIGAPTVSGAKKASIIFVPTDAELIEQGRNDLRYALRQHSKEKIAKVGKMRLRTERMTYEESRAEMNKWKFESGSRSLFLNWCKAGHRPWNMPKSPQEYYGKRGEWVSWDHFMTTSAPTRGRGGIARGFAHKVN